MTVCRLISLPDGLWEASMGPGDFEFQDAIQGTFHTHVDEVSFRADNPHDAIQGCIALFTSILIDRFYSMVGPALMSLVK